MSSYLVWNSNYLKSRLLTRILGSVRVVHIAMSSLVLMSGYRFLWKSASNSWSCWEVKCVLCLRLPLALTATELLELLLDELFLLLLLPGDNLTQGVWYLDASPLFELVESLLRELFSDSRGEARDPGVGGCCRLDRLCPRWLLRCPTPLECRSAIVVEVWWEDEPPPLHKSEYWKLPGSENEWICL